MSEQIFTDEEKTIIRATWKPVTENYKHVGFKLFQRFFTENPSYQKLFKSFKDVSIEELYGNSKVSAHASQVLYTITALLDNLEDTSCLIEMLNKLGRNHQRRKIDRQKFENLGVTIIGLLKETLGDEVMNEKAINIWKRAYGIIVDTIDTEMERVKKAKESDD